MGCSESTAASKTVSETALKASHGLVSSIMPLDLDDSTELEKWHEKIHNKLKSSGQLSDVSTEEQKQEMIRALGDADTFVEKHLKLEKHLNKKLLKKLQEEMECGQHTTVHDEEEAEKIIDCLLDYRRRSTEFDIRIFFTCLQGLNTNNTVVGVVGRVATYGPVHVGLEISGVPLHWNTTSLVSLVPDSKPFLSYSRVYLGRMRHDENMFEKVIQESKLSTVQQAENYYQRLVQMHYDTKREAFMNLGRIAADKLHKIAEICVWYNKFKMYNVLHCNCQTFIDDILKAIGITFKPEDEFQRFMERIRTSSSDKDLFIYKDQTFASRNQLDHYVDQNWESETSNWNKRLLIQYSDLMDSIYLRSEKKDTNWGPMTKHVWYQRLESIF